MANSRLSALPHFQSARLWLLRRGRIEEEEEEDHLRWAWLAWPRRHTRSLATHGFPA